MNKPLIFLKLMIILAISLLGILACSYSGELIEVNVTSNDGEVQYVIAFPDYMKLEEEKQFNEHANLQYCSFYRNVYAIVLDEAKTTSNENLSKYAQEELGKLEGVLKKSLRIDSSQIEIDNKEAIQIQLTGKVGEGEVEKRIFYRLVFFETKEHLFQLVLWGWDERRQEYLEDFDKILTSFRLL